MIGRVLLFLIRPLVLTLEVFVQVIIPTLVLSSSHLTSVHLICRYLGPGASPSSHPLPPSPNASNVPDATISSTLISSLNVCFHHLRNSIAIRESNPNLGQGHRDIHLLIIRLEHEVQHFLANLVCQIVGARFLYQDARVIGRAGEEIVKEQICQKQYGDAGLCIGPHFEILLYPSLRLRLLLTDLCAKDLALRAYECCQRPISPPMLTSSPARIQSTKALASSPHPRTPSRYPQDTSPCHPSPISRSPLHLLSPLYPTIRNS